MEIVVITNVPSVIQYFGQTIGNISFICFALFDNSIVIEKSVADAFNITGESRIIAMEDIKFYVVATFVH